MSSTLLSVLILLFGQIADFTGDRYADEPTPVRSDVAPDLATEASAEPSTAEAATAQQSSETPNSQNLFDTPATGESATLEIDSFDISAQPLSPPSNTAPADSPATSPQVSPPLGRTETLGPAVESNPTKVLAEFFEVPTGSELKGTPIALADALETSISRGEQSQRVVAYWELSQAVANYYLSLKERTELAALRQGILQPSTDWETSRETAESRVAISLDRARVAQQYLAQTMANTTLGFAPLPSDPPYCGAYETRYAQIFLNRASTLAEQLNEYLPRAYDDLILRTSEIDAARRWMFAVSDSRGPRSDGNELLKAYELFAARRRNFVNAVREYNLGIVRYTEIATPGTLETERLVAMLIRTGRSPGSTFDSNIERAGAQEDSSGGAGSTNPGVSDWQPSSSNTSERSILVPRS